MQLRRSKGVKTFVAESFCPTPFSGVPQTELPCPCGRNARRCVDPRLGASCVAVPGQPAASSHSPSHATLLLILLPKQLYASVDAEHACLRRRKTARPPATAAGSACRPPSRRKARRRRLLEPGLSAMARDLQRCLPGAPEPVHRSFPARAPKPSAGLLAALPLSCSEALRVRRERQALQLDGRVAQRTNQSGIADMCSHFGSSACVGQGHRWARGLAALYSEGRCVCQRHLSGAFSGGSSATSASRPLPTVRSLAQRQAEASLLKSGSSF